jgi:hypothetical protein
MIRNVHKPSAVSASEPARCAAAVASAQPGSPRSNERTTSAENVENVVRPPSTPVMMNRRHSGDSSLRQARSAMAAPTS